MKQRIGVAGCGRMGLPMARSLAHAGFDVAGFDIRPVSEFGDFAPCMIADPAAFAAHAEVVLTVVRDAAETEALLFRDLAILKRRGAIRTLIVCSTLSPRFLLSLRDAVPPGIEMVDAPMSGAAVAAEERRLSFMLGGDAATLDRLEPLFLAMGKDIHRLGGLGAGMTAKVLNNLVAASSTVATRAALSWAEALGLDRRALLGVMHDSSGQTWFGSNFDRIEFAHDGHDALNTIGILVKDVESALDAAPDRAEDERALAAALIAALRALRPL